MNTTNPYLVTVEGLVYDDLPHPFQEGDIVQIVNTPDTENIKINFNQRIHHHFTTDHGPVEKSLEWQRVTIPIGKFNGKIYRVRRRVIVTNLTRSVTYDLLAVVNGGKHPITEDDSFETIGPVKIIKEKGYRKVIEQVLRCVPVYYLRKSNDEMYNQGNGWTDHPEPTLH